MLKAEFPLDTQQEPRRGEWEAACRELTEASAVPWVLLSVMAPSCTVACNCMLRSASCASACEASVGMRHTCSFSRRESLVSMPFHQISAAWLKQ